MNRQRGKDSVELRAQIETVLRAEIDAELAAAHDAFDAAMLRAIARCAGQAAEYLRADDAKPELARALERCLARNGLPAPHHDDLAAWKELADLGLVGLALPERFTESTWRSLPATRRSRGSTYHRAPMLAGSS